jgi:DNA-directed RNA polymerase II subunit RPB2
MSVKLTKDNSNKLIDLYFSQPNILYNHQYNSYNQFIEESIPHILKSEDNIFFTNSDNEYVTNYMFKFDDIYLKPPTLENESELMFPSDARVRSLTYSSKLIATVTQIQQKINVLTGEKQEKQIGEKEYEYHVTNIPIMVRSKVCSLNIKKNYDKKECNYDAGGYFIINGNEKVVITLERMIENKPLVFYKKDQSTKIYTVQVNSKDYKTDIIQIFTIKMKKYDNIIMKMPQFNEISIFILLKALGLETDKDIINYTVYNAHDLDMINILRECLDNTVDDNGIKILTKEDAIRYLLFKLKSNKKYKGSIESQEEQKRIHLNNILEKNILPHMGPDLFRKSYYICYMINKLLKCYLGRISIDDRDSFVNKRMDTPGVLMSQLFKQYFKKLLNDCNKFFRKRFSDDSNALNIISQIKPNTIEQGLKSALLTGSWGGSKNKKGVAQVLSRLSFLYTISSLRRISSNIGDASTNKLTSPRHLHNTQYGFICPVETPEGQKVGLVKSLALTSDITLMLKSQIHIIKSNMDNLIDLNNLHPKYFSKYIKVFLNGEWLGMTKMPQEMVNKLKLLKQKNKLDKTVSIVWNILDKEIKIYCDNGRLYRPLLKVENNKLLITQKILDNISLKETTDTSIISKWSDLLNKYPEVIEYVDIEESINLMISMYDDDLEKNIKISKNKVNKTDDIIINRYDNNVYVNYTHCEIHPSLMLGAVASSIPLCNHNQGPRNIFQYSQARQAMGLYNSSYRHRLDLSYILYNAQYPLVTTRANRYLHTEEMAAGENAIVAICTYTGYNQEDSIIVNQSAIERGLFRAMSLKKKTETISKNPSTSQDDIFTKPDKNKVISTKSGSYDKLNMKGFVPEETILENGDIIIGKISPIQPVGNKVYKDSSVTYKENIPGVVDKMWHGIYNSEGYEMYKMRLRMDRVPKIGDKFASKHGQKGTIGLTLKQEDMPFTEEGIIPDIIVNPHAMPSRMTIGQLIECLLGKTSAITGQRADGTPFNRINVDEIRNKLKKLGYHDSGKEYLYNGLTGQKMKAMIFIGPTYYQRLKHLVDDKIHSRARGPRQLLTRQPPEGRARDGGLRFGEMERDCMIAHGMGQFLKERMMETSDIYSMHVCDICGLIAQQILGKPGAYKCNSCNNTTDISKINTTYAYKLMTQELMSMNIAPRIRTKKDVYSDLV